MQRDSKSAIVKLSHPAVGQAYDEGGEVIVTIDVPVLLITADPEKGEQMPVVGYPFYDRYDPITKTGVWSVIVPTDHRRIYEMKLGIPDGVTFRIEDKIATMTISDIEASVIQQEPQYTNEVILFFKHPVITINKRSQLAQTKRMTALKTFIKLHNPKKTKVIEVEDDEPVTPSRHPAEKPIK